MEINDSKKNTRFCDISCGQCFYFNGKYYIKSVKYLDEMFGVDLCDGTYKEFNLSDTVSIVNAVINVLSINE